jgi:GMP synthase (glutamine-hydrolysing)
MINLESYLQEQLIAIQQTTAGQQVLLALSGGLDSSVCAKLLAKAIPGQLVCVFVDHGLMRKNEGNEVEAMFADSDMTFVRVNAETRFLSALKGVTDPEEKRKRVGAEFIRVFEEEAKKLGNISFLAQGTIKLDVDESKKGLKSHHNVGGLPAELSFSGIIEPLRGLEKDEVRALGRMLGLPNAFVERQPFPGPGLCVRVMGEVTKDKLTVLREADAIFRQELEQSGITAHQYFAVFTGIQSTGIKGGKRAYENVIALRAVTTDDFLTCRYIPLPHEILSHCAGRIINEVPGVGRVVYDITDKPPGTLEWE